MSLGQGLASHGQAAAQYLLRLHEAARGHVRACLTIERHVGNDAGKEHPPHAPGQPIPGQTDRTGQIPQFKAVVEKRGFQLGQIVDSAGPGQVDGAALGTDGVLEVARFLVGPGKRLQDVDILAAGKFSRPFCHGQRCLGILLAPQFAVEQLPRIGVKRERCGPGTQRNPPQIGDALGNERPDRFRLFLVPQNT